jgi:ABC-type uncharacterized transport system substrate-binding protein
MPSMTTRQLFSKAMSGYQHLLVISKIRTLANRACLLFFAITVCNVISSKAVEPPRTYRIGFLESGEHLLNSPLREAFRLHILDLLKPDTALFQGKWYWSANWKPDSLRDMAETIAHTKPVDLIVAIGPNAAGALQAAGTQIPILSYQRGMLDPSLDTTKGLLVALYEPDMVPADLSTMRSLFKSQKIGVLIYTDSARVSPDIDLANEFSRELRIPITVGSGYNNIGQFAFFKSFQSLPKDIDAVYVGPLYGLRSSQVDQFLQQMIAVSLPVFAADGRIAVDRGATASIAGNLTTHPARQLALEAVGLLRKAHTSGGTKRLSTITQLTVNLASLRSGSKVIGDNILSAAVLTGVKRKIGSPLTLHEALEFATLGNDRTVTQIESLEEHAGSKQSWLPDASIEGAFGIVNDAAVENSSGGYRKSRGTVLGVLEKEFSLWDSPTEFSGNSYEQRKNQIVLHAEKQAAIAYINLARSRMLQELTVRDVAYTVQGNESVQARKFTNSSEPVEQLRWQALVQRALARQLSRKIEVEIGEVELATSLGRPSESKFLLDTLSLLGPNLEQAISILLIALNREDTVHLFSEKIAATLIKRTKSTVAARPGTGNLFSSAPTLGLRGYFGLSDSLLRESASPVAGIQGSIRIPVFGEKKSRSVSHSAETFSEVSVEPNLIEVTALIESRLLKIKELLLLGQFAAKEQQMFEGAVTDLIPEITTSGVASREIEDLIERLFSAEAKQVEYMHEALLVAVELITDAEWSLSTSNRSPFDEVLHHLERAKVELESGQ